MHLLQTLAINRMLVGLRGDTLRLSTALAVRKVIFGVVLGAVQMADSPLYWVGLGLAAWAQI